MSFKKFLELAKNMPALTELQKLRLHKARYEIYIKQCKERIARFQAWSRENQKRAKDDREYGTCSEDLWNLHVYEVALQEINEKIACLEAKNSV